MQYMSFTLILLSFEGMTGTHNTIKQITHAATAEITQAIAILFFTNPQYPEMGARQTSAEKTPLCTVRPLYEEFCEWISAFPDL